MKLTFENYVKLNEYFDSDEGITSVSKSILKTVSEAIDNKKKTVELFEVTLIEEDECMSIKLDEEQWSTAIKSCLEHFERLELSDDSIDAYLLLQKLNNSN